MAKTWIGLLEVSENGSGNILNGASGGFATVVGLAENIVLFEEAVRRATDSIGLVFRNLEEIDEYEKRILEFDIDSKVKELVLRLNASQPVLFATFHTFKES